MADKSLDHAALAQDIRVLTKKATGLLSQMNNQLQKLRDKNQKAAEEALWIRVQLAASADHDPLQAAAAAAPPAPLALPAPPAAAAPCSTRPGVDSTAAASNGVLAAIGAVDQLGAADDLPGAAATLPGSTHAAITQPCDQQQPQHPLASAQQQREDEDAHGADGGPAAREGAPGAADSDASLSLCRGSPAHVPGVMVVNKAEALMSPLIQREVVQNGLGLPASPPVLLPKQVSPTAWSMVAEYCAFHAVPGRSDKERRMFDERFIRRDSSALCDLTSAADALEMRGLVDLASRAIARLIEGKSAEQIREAFRLPDDLTEEEKLEPIAAVPGATLDPRVRLLNRLYAKRRQELQQRRSAPRAAAGADRAQQAEQQGEDERSLEELLSFIESAGGGGGGGNRAGSGGKGKKKKARQAEPAAPAPHTQQPQQQQQQQLVNGAGGGGQLLAAQAARQQAHAAEGSAPFMEEPLRQPSSPGPADAQPPSASGPPQQASVQPSAQGQAGVRSAQARLQQLLPLVEAQAAAGDGPEAAAGAALPAAAPAALPGAAAAPSDCELCQVQLDVLGSLMSPAGAAGDGGAGPPLSSLPPSCSRYLLPGRAAELAGGPSRLALLAPTPVPPADPAQENGHAPAAVTATEYAARAALTYRPVTVLTSLANFRGASHVRRLTPQPCPGGRKTPALPARAAPAALPARAPASAAAVGSSASSMTGGSSGGSSRPASPREPAALASAEASLAAAAVAASAVQLPGNGAAEGRAASDQQPGAAAAEPARATAIPLRTGDAPAWSPAEAAEDPAAPAAEGLPSLGAADVAAAAAALSSFLSALGLDRHLKVVPAGEPGPGEASAPPSLPIPGPAASARELPCGGRLQLLWAPPQAGG